MQAVPLYDLPSDLDEVGQDLKYDAHWNLKVCLTSALPASDMASLAPAAELFRHCVLHLCAILEYCVPGLMAEELSRLAQSHSYGRNRQC